MMRPTLIMPETFEDCLTYTKQLRKLYEESTNYETTAHANETFATKESLNGYETTEHANETFATKASLNDYETTAHANETFATKESLNDYETTAHATETYATKSELQNVHIVVDDTVSSNSQNAVSSKGIFDFVTDQTADLATVEDLNTKQDTLTFDETPTLNSPNPATSGGIYDSIKAVKESMNNYTPLTDFNQYKEQVDADYLGKEEASATYVSQPNLSALLDQYEPKAHAENTYATKLELINYPTQQYVEGQYATKTELNSKQDWLTFDNTPKSGSRNPVTSEGIYYAIQNRYIISKIKQLGRCQASFSDSDSWNNSTQQQLTIYTKDYVGDVEINAYCDYDVNLQNYAYNKFSWLLLNYFSPAIPYASGSEQPSEDGYGCGHADFSLMLGRNFYIGDIISVAFTDSNNNLYAYSVPSASERRKRYYINLDKSIAQTLTKGHISFRLRLLI